MLAVFVVVDLELSGVNWGGDWWCVRVWFVAEERAQEGLGAAYEDFLKKAGEAGKDLGDELAEQLNTKCEGADRRCKGEQRFASCTARLVLERSLYKPARQVDD